MVMHYLHKKRIIKNNVEKSMVIAMNNCGGQNKNNSVICLAPHLVEMGFFQQCEVNYTSGAIRKTPATKPSIK
jgi:hypothetical protein